MLQILTNDNNMTERKLVRVTSTPVSVETHFKDIRGVLNFPTEVVALGEHTTEVHHKSSSIQYKNNIINNREDDNEEDRKKRQVESLELVVEAAKYSKKVFKVEMPIITGPKGVRQNRSNTQYFTLQLVNNGGKLMLMHGYYDFKAELMSKPNNDLSHREKMELQTAKLDNRRKEDVGPIKRKRNENQSDD